MDEPTEVPGAVLSHAGRELGSVKATKVLYATMTGTDVMLAQLDVTYARPDAMIPPKKLEVQVKKPDTRVIAPRWAGQ